MRGGVGLLIIGLAAASPSLVAAEDSKTCATANPVMETSVPELECTRPKLPERLVTASEVADFTKRVDTYAACATRYVNDRRAQAQIHRDLAKQEADASNAAVTDINDFFSTAKQIAEKNKDKTKN
jgi:hypothetical protein